ncbi:MAG: helix-turn-helix transcriptional regulator [Ruminococcaceae bacterium]|nr:helix-turn-helix transcriptional regulator [Oscillospiraceae bacterium]
MVIIMNIKIGTIIKKLRTENNITQDALATAIGVTPQAISRWESEGCYPDIELLPALADFFSVSTDELLGYKLSQREEEIANIKKEISRLAEEGTIDERIAFARNAISRYPADFEIKENLAVCLYHLWQDAQNIDLVKEIENLCSSLLDDCKDEDIRYVALIILIGIYGKTKQNEKVMHAVNMLTPMKYCRETVMSQGIGDGNTELYIQDEIDKLTDALGGAIENLALNEELPNDPSTWDKKIEMLDISNQIYKLIYGDNLMFYHVRLSRNYWLISTYQISQGKKDDALESLENMCYHAVEYDRSYINDHGKFYTSILTDKLVYPEPGKDFHELTYHSDCYYMLDRLASKRYSMREEPRFITVIEKLSEYSK